MNKSIWTVSIGCFIFFLTSPQAAAGPKKVKKESFGNITILNQTIPEKSVHYFLFLQAAYQHAQGNAAKALKTYQHLLRHKPSPHAYAGFFQLLSDLGQHAVILKTYEANQAVFKKTFANNIIFNLIVAQSYVSTNQDDLAESIFVLLSKENPDNEQVAYFTAMAYFKNNQYDKALEFVDRCLQNPALKQRFFLFHFLKSKVLVQQNKPQEALAEIEKGLKLFPKFDRGWLLKAMLLEQLGQVNDAIKGYKHFLDLVGRDLTVEKQIVQLLFSQQRFSEALNYLKRIKHNSPDYFFDVALIEFKTGNMKKALENLNKAIALAPQFNKARLLKVEILLATKDINTLLTFMGDWLSSDVEDLSVLHTLLLLRKTNVSTAKIIKTLQVVEKKKSHINILAAIADLSAETNNTKQAIGYYEKILAGTSDPSTKSKTLFRMGYLYYTSKQLDKLEKTLEQALAYEPVYPSVYNLLALHYARANIKLPQALELVEKALSIAPHCPYYLDTKANVLLRLGRKNEALGVFNKALSIAPEDKIIQAHLKQAQESH